MPETNGHTVQKAPTSPAVAQAAENLEREGSEFRQQLKELARFTLAFKKKHAKEQILAHGH